MRVISGKLKGRKLKGYNLEGTRPTMDKIKESLFAMIQKDIKDTICLDLFAGSGSLGIEAISNGAKLCYFVDYNKQVIDIIKDNISHFNIEEQSSLLLSDYQDALINFKKQNIHFNLIFLDPPYQKCLIEDILTFIIENGLLKQEGQVICEYTEDILKDEYGLLKLIKERKYGDKKVRIYKYSK